MLNNEYYALKEVPKYMLYPKSKIYSHLTEPNILKRFTKYDFLPKIISSFQDYDNIYLITTYYDGQSLRFINRNNMTEEQIKFISACTIQSFIFMRKEKIIHRDITFNNIIMDKNKYFNVIDFSFAIDYSQKDNKEKYFNTFECVTPPEMLKLKRSPAGKNAPSSFPYRASRPWPISGYSRFHPSYGWRRRSSRPASRCSCPPRRPARRRRSGCPPSPFSGYSFPKYHPGHQKEPYLYSFYTDDAFATICVL